VRNPGALESEPLHLHLLNAIVRQPGINRRGLHEATGNRIKSLDIVQALGILESQRLALRRLSHSEGGGRRGECWYPGPGDDPGDCPGDDDGGKAIEQTPIVSSGFTMTMRSDAADVKAELIHSLASGESE